MIYSGSLQCLPILELYRIYTYPRLKIGSQSSCKTFSSHFSLNQAETPIHKIFKLLKQPSAILKECIVLNAVDLTAKM